MNHGIVDTLLAALPTLRAEDLELRDAGRGTVEVIVPPPLAWEAQEALAETWPHAHVQDAVHPDDAALCACSCAECVAGRHRACLMYDEDHGGNGDGVCPAIEAARARRPR